MLLVLAAGVTGAILEGSLLRQPGRLTLFLLGLYLTGGSANALNQFFERAIDSRMSRTAGRRPLPLGELQPRQALAFSVAIGLIGVVLLGTVFNLLTAMLALGVILFYSLFYTLWLKPYTDQNIVIGGIAGAMAPVGAWTAATGSMAVTPWLVFAIIFFWTPPHFWSLALRFEGDYRRTGLPMMPLTQGVSRTHDLIVTYTVVLGAVSLLPLLAGFGWIYAAAAVPLGAIFLLKAMQARRSQTAESAWAVFRFSIFYLFCVLFALILDRVTNPESGFVL
jgi:protoheme IX farnesyltransferase